MNYTKKLQKEAVHNQNAWCGIQMEKKIQSYQYIISESDTSVLKSRKWRDEKANYKCIPKMWENENESKPEGEI